MKTDPDPKIVVFAVLPRCSSPRAAALGGCAAVPLSLSLYIYLCISMCVYISLSLSIYIYIYMHTMYTYNNTIQHSKLVLSFIPLPTRQWAEGAAAAVVSHPLSHQPPARPPT